MTFLGCGTLSTTYRPSIFMMLPVFLLALLLPAHSFADSFFTDASIVTVTVYSGEELGVRASYTTSSTVCSVDADTPPTFMVEWDTYPADWSGEGYGSGPTETDDNGGPYYEYVIFGLQPSTSYDVRVTYSDPDGVDACGTSPVIVNLSSSFPATTGIGISTYAMGLSSPMQTATIITAEAAYSSDINDNNSVTFEYSRAGQGAWSPATGETVDRQAKIWSVVIPGLQKNTSYDIRATFTDPDGMATANPNILTVSTQNISDKNTFTSVFASPACTGATLSLEAAYYEDSDDDNSVLFEYTPAGQGSWSTIAGESVDRVAKVWSVTATDLFPNTAYDFRATFTDLDGILNVNPLTFTASTQSGPDDLTSTIGLSVPSITGTTAMLRAVYLGDDNSDNTVAFDYSKSGLGSWTPLTDVTTDRSNKIWTANASGLTPNTSYDFRATFTDPDGVQVVNPLTATTSSTAGRRDIELEFSKGSHHVGTAWANMTAEACAACHAEGNADGTVNSTYHKNGPVDLKVYGTYPAVASVVGYTEAVTPAAEMTPFCLGCHNDSNSSAQPFISAGDTATPGAYDVASGGADAGSIATRYNATGTEPFSKYSPVTNNVVPQIQKAYSPHGNASGNERGVATTGAWYDDGGSTNIACFDCHNSHGSDTGVSGTLPMTTYSSAVGGKRAGIIKETTSYVPNESISGTAHYSAASDLCFDCHLGDDAASPRMFTDYSCSAPVRGYYDAGRWQSSDIWASSFSYKTSQPTGNGSGMQIGGHFGASTTMQTVPTAQVNGLCTACHDPHGVNPSKTNAEYMVPSLKGAWMTSPYKEDRAPGTQGSNFGQSLTGMDSIWYVYYTTRSGDSTQWKPTRFNPRFDSNNPPIIGAGYGAGISGSTNWDVGGTGGDGYFIDDNTFGTNITYGFGSNRQMTDVYTTGTNGERPWGVTTVTANRIYETDTQFAGLCLGCHPQADLEAVSYSNGTDTIKVHNTVKGWYSSANAADLFKDSQAAEHLMSYTNSYSPSNAMRCTYVYTGTTPYIMPAGYRWSVVPGATPCTRSTHTIANPPDTANTQSVLGYKQAAFHQFPCSKCHSAHTSKLPRLMKTNCLDVGPSSSYPKHRGGNFDYPESCDQGYADNAGVTMDVMLQCHNLKKSNMPGAGGWNTKTGW